MSQLGDLIENVKTILDQNSQNPIDNNTIKRAISSAYKYYFAFIARYGDGYFEHSENVGITSGVNYIDLSSLSKTFHQIRAVYRVFSNRLILMKRVSLRDGEIDNFVSPSGNSFVPDYDISGIRLEIMPTPTVTEAASSTTGLLIKYVYAPIFPTYSSSDSFEFDSNFRTVHEPCIELRSAISCLNQKSIFSGNFDGSSGLLKELSEHETILAQSISRDQSMDSIPYTGESYYI
jgi:hypothetical protein